MSADAGFVHLHVHSSYSLLEGALTIGRLAELAKADRQPALALTDTDNMFGALEFSDKMAAAGIQPIIGAALSVAFADGIPSPAETDTALRSIPGVVETGLFVGLADILVVGRAGEPEVRERPASAPRRRSGRIDRNAARP